MDLMPARRKDENWLEILEKGEVQSVWEFYFTEEVERLFGTW